MAITWEASIGAQATPAPTAELPNLFQLSAPPGTFALYVGSASPGLTPSVTWSTTDYFAVYVETATDRGRRQFKFEVDGVEPSLQFGYRYQVGLGDRARSGEMQSTTLDLAALAEAVEPGITITGVQSIFIRLDGAMLMQVAVEPVPPPPLPDPGAEMAPAEIVRFLNQASFGASRDTIQAVTAAGSFGAWIDLQLNLPVSLTEPYTRANGNSSNPVHRHDIWWRNVMEEPDQLRQRLAFAWSQIFVISDNDYALANAQYGVTNYYDMLAQLADGNFRTLLERVTLHPVMGIYLSMVRNERADPARNVRPDENFAREVLQLFTIGLHELTPDGEVQVDGSGRPIATYDQTTVEEFAKVFTGWNFDRVRSWSDNNVNPESMVVPMVANETYHDTSEKRLLQSAVLPAGQSAYDDLTVALDNIFAHPNVGPFVSRLLIQRLVTSNPTPQYVGRVAAVFNDNGAGVRGDLRATTKALLLDPEARNGATDLPSTFGKIKEPIMRLTNLWRAFDAQPGPDAAGRYRSYSAPGNQVGNVLGQAPLSSPSVFNFYTPDHPLEPGSDLVGPEMQVLSEIQVAATNNMLLQCVYGDNNRSTEYRQNITQIQIEPVIELAADVPALLDWLDVVLCAGQLHRQCVVRSKGSSLPIPTTTQVATCE